MKKIAILILLGVLALTPEFTQAAESNSNKTEVFSKGRKKGKRNKSGRYKRKKGFLGGIFKRKSQCDCPKH